MSAYRFLTIFFGILLWLPGQSQSLYRVPLEEKVREAPLIVEGRVLSEYSYWNAAHNMIYTAHRVELYKLFKGSVAVPVIEILTTGGVVGDTFVVASDLLTLHNGETGLFFCRLSSPLSALSGRQSYEVYASSQGVLKYDLATGSANAPYARYPDIRSELYPLLTSATGRGFRDLRPSFRVEDGLLETTSRFEAPSILNFSPSMVTAGKRIDPSTNRLTIDGAGFGTPTGSAAVLFDNPDDGTGGTPFVLPASSELISSWTDTRIVLSVPSGAGTGFFSVRDAGGVTTTSATALDVFYSLITLNFGASPFVRMLCLQNVNGAGGYDYVYSASTANGGRDLTTAAEEAPFNRAVATWKEMVGLNYAYAGTTLQQTQRVDGVNLIMLDNRATGNPPLPAGVLGVCYTAGTSCGGSEYAYRVDFDIVIRNAGVSDGTTFFNNGPCATRIDTVAQIDMESVLLHELGHALNLAHINDSYKGSSLSQLDPQKVMNFQIVNGVDRRSPDWSCLEAARFSVGPKGVGAECGRTEMVPLPTLIAYFDECPGTFPSSPTPLNSTVSFDLVHTSSNRFVDPQYTRVKNTGAGTGITNNAWLALRTNASGGTLNLTVTGYRTNPVAQEACPGSGIELSVYAVNGCPAAQSFPPPVAYRTFNGNGSITSIAGLSPNTNYLLMFDGISNTKAEFNVTLIGTALPTQLLEFHGRSVNGASVLKWTSETEENLDAYQLEVSRAGGAYFAISRQLPRGERNRSQEYNFTDAAPWKGLNTYRLRMIDRDGRISFSDPVSLSYETMPFLVVFPNPVNDEIRLRFAGTVTDLEMRLYSMDGRLMMQQRRHVSGRLVSVDASRLAPGLYQLETVVDGHRTSSRIIKR